jgi:hypothetical protein
MYSVSTIEHSIAKGNNSGKGKKVQLVPEETQIRHPTEVSGSRKHCRRQETCHVVKGGCRLECLQSGPLQLKPQFKKDAITFLSITEPNLTR